MKIGLFGGTFDPIHLTHTKIAYQAYCQLSLDEVWFIPVLHNPFQKQIVASDKQRSDMISIAIQNYPMFKISKIELEKNSEIPSYTYDTIMELKQLHKEDNFYYIIGYDQVNAFHLWYKADEIAKNVQLVCFSRLGYEETRQNIIDYSMLQLEIIAEATSSSAIRQGSLQNIDTKVIHYFVTHGIYLDTLIKNRMSEYRYLHTVSMASLAKAIAKANNYDETKAYVTGMLHDIAKDIDKVKENELMKCYYPQYLMKPEHLWHQWLGEYIAKEEFKVDDAEVLHAITVHTTGCLSMSILDKIIYTADKLDPFRGYDSKELIAKAMDNIHIGFRETLSSNVKYLREKKVTLDEDTKQIYKKYVEEQNE